MKQYRITSANFVTPGETGDADAVMDAADLAQIKKLAGIHTLSEDYYEAGGHDPALTTPNDNTNSSRMSPVGSIIPGADRRSIERRENIKVGSPEWFKLWFAKPELTGEKPVGDAPAPRVKNPNYKKFDPTKD